MFAPVLRAAGRAFERHFIRTGFDESSMRRQVEALRPKPEGKARRFPRLLPRFNYREPRRHKKGGVG